GVLRRHSIGVSYKPVQTVASILKKKKRGTNSTMSSPQALCVEWTAAHVTRSALVNLVVP
ncbi:hypothetical protein, partial [Salmonella sp. s54395]|uniref:hypothetical protein n=1 Tax=Salmonella sp. s54395 TaxID=3159664 RepID=UPI00397EF4F6